MALKPEISVPAGLAVATLVFTIYRQGMPNSADVRVQEADNEALETVRKQNAWLAAATVAGISLVAKDPVIFIVGGAMVVVLDWFVRINNATNPVTNTIDRLGHLANPAEQVPAATEASTYMHSVA